LANLQTLTSQRNFNMSIFKIIVKNPISQAAIFKLYKILGTSISEIKKRIGSGEPIFDNEIFGNDYKEKSTILRKIIAMSADGLISIEIIIESLEKDKDLDSTVNAVISREVLKNILDSADSESERF